MKNKFGLISVGSFSLLCLSVSLAQTNQHPPLLSVKVSLHGMSTHTTTTIPGAHQSQTRAHWQAVQTATL